MKIVLVAIDFSPHSESVLKVGLSVARAYDADVFLIHVAPPDPDFVGHDVGPPSVRKSLAEKYRSEHAQLARWCERFSDVGLHATPLLMQGQTVGKLLQESERLHADMIVTGSHGHSLLRSMVLGSVSEGLVKGANCPVLIVPCRPQES